MKFRKAVEQTPEIADCLRKGLEALEKAHRDRVTAAAPKRVEGSVNLDAALERKHPHAPRWDYAIGYRLTSQADKLFLVEYHKARVDEVRRVLAKKRWLDEWLVDKPLGQIRERRYMWVSAGGVHIPPHAPERRLLNSCAVVLVRRLELE